MMVGAGEGGVGIGKASGFHGKTMSQQLFDDKCTNTVLAYNVTTRYLHNRKHAQIHTQTAQTL